MRTSALDSILKNYGVIRAELEQVSRESCGDPASNASGYLSLMEKFETFFGLQLSYLVFSATEQLSRTLQMHDINAQDVAMAASQAVSFLSRQRSDEAFSEFYQSTASKAKNPAEPHTLQTEKNT